VASKSKRARTVKQRNLANDFMYWAIAVFIIKLIIIGNVQGGAWLGADGENYQKGYEFLIRDGIFSKESILNYWPAGYPLFILLLSVIGKSFVFTTLAIVQSAFFSFAAYFFAANLVKTRLKKFSYLIFLIILLNPTLSLSSIAVGYESLAASGYLIVLGLMIKNLINKNEKTLLLDFMIAAGVFGFMSFMQPRLIVSALILIPIWALVRKPIKSASLITVIAFIVILFFPSTLIYRNHVATGQNSISTNLGVTMNIGAGDKATGAYAKDGFGVKCDRSGTVAQQDNQLVRCVINWYISHPGKALKLFYNKSIYFWSPWFGPEAIGTMARNPWLKISPLQNIANSSPDGGKLIYGGFGKAISWFWLIGSFLIGLYGAIILWRSKSLERVIGLFAIISIATSWLITMISIGDNRFRLPIMGMSLFLQAVGIRTLFKGGKPPMVDGPALR
jgi:hypothetical protein